MKYLSTTENFSVSNIILGCMRISSLSTASLEKLVDTALSQGITLFDHADIYGGEHLCEKRFGEILKQTPSLRCKMLIQTKCGITKCGYDFSREHILKQVNDSLAALETDYVDILLLHRPDTLLDPCEVAEAFSILKKSGKVRHFGVSNFSPMQTEFLQKSLDEKLFTNQIQLSLAHSLIFDEGISFNSALPSASVCSSSCLEYSRLNNILL
ncbi:MAG: aldo/keto reductase, partial [Oscillospiraceae bacterium]